MQDIPVIPSSAPRRTPAVALAALVASTLLAPLAPVAPLAAQTARGARGDTTEVRYRLRDRERLLAALDSLQRQFESEGMNSADRARLQQQLGQLLVSLARVSQASAEIGARLGMEIGAQVSAEVARSMMAAREEQRVGQFDLPRAALMASGRTLRLRDVMPRGWIGINVEAPHMQEVRGDSVLLRYFDYPEIVSVEPNSPAEHAGIERGEQLIAYDGSDVRDRPINVTRLLQPGRKLRVTVRHEGERRDRSVVVGRAPDHLISRLVEANDAPDPDGPPPPPTIATSRFRGATVMGGAGGSGGGGRVFIRTQSPPGAPSAPLPPGATAMWTLPSFDADRAPLAGANLVAITNEGLGRPFGVRAGVLVADAAPGGPARESGLRGGDVIVRAAGQEVLTVRDLQRQLVAHADDRALELEVVREKRPRKVTLKW